MSDFPIMLKVRGRRCVVVGGGGVAARRARTLRDAGAEVLVVAPEVDPAIDELAIAIERRPYQTNDLDGARLVVAATDDRELNDRIARDAEARGVLVNRADVPGAGDFSVPAHAHHGPVTIAADTSGISASAAAKIRRSLSEALDPDWPRLLECARPFRAEVQQRFVDPQERQDRLRRLTDEDAMAMLKARGDEALRERCRRIARGET
ncbi:MAG: precorrin-2 dehydrogenase/sirohydrochlorin ferrochelatase family protein [Phycisphaeraceae bacterium]